MKSYDQKKESKHIIYSDANNLHGRAMFKFLPMSSFKWLDPSKFDLNKYTSNSSKGCALEVDLEYYILSFILFDKEKYEIHYENLQLY